MTATPFRTALLALAAGGLTVAAPASALPTVSSSAYSEAAPVYGETTFNQYRDRWDRRDRRYDRRYQNYGQRYDDRYRGQQAWRGDDGRYYCRKSDGTTGLLIGGAAGALLGREVAGRNGDRTLGAILGAAGGALLGKSIDSGTKCR